MSEFKNIKKRYCGKNIYYISGESSLGIECYFYLEADSLKKPLLEKLEDGDKVKLSDYGQIILKGYGEPSLAIKKKMQEEYGFIDDDAK
jgi:hypothetical protein